jgi:uncharacterized membrane protein (UPF0127 family)
MVSRVKRVSTYLIISVLSLGLLVSYISSHSNVVSNAQTDPYQLSNAQEKNAYIVYVKQKIKQDSDCQPGLKLGQLKKQKIVPSENFLCNPGLENMKKKVKDAQANGGGKDKQISKFNDIIKKKQDKLNAKFDKIREKLEKAISEPEGEKPISQDEQNKVAEQDKKDTAEHKTQTGDNCRSGNVLDGASNQPDLKVLADCQEATGEVMHTKKMNDGDYKFFLDVDDKYKFLNNDVNKEKTNGFLVVEVVPKDQDISTVYLPKEGDKVDIHGAWVTDEKKGWHEIHPTWVVTKQ